MSIITEHNVQQSIDAFIAYVYRTINTEDSSPLVFWIDLFSGAGGTSTGIHLVESRRAFVAACVNHDTNAINSHKENHPEALHFIEDVRDFMVVMKLRKLVDRLRKEFPNCIINIWASLECTNFSKAKGGLPRDADSRTLADHMFMYLENLKPNYFWVENVREFMSWGPLDENGKPVSRTEGADYIRWISKVQAMGYKFDKKLLNAADYGAYQSRERYFAQFAKPGYPISWPQQTHTKDKSVSGLFPMERWRPVKEVLDLDDEGQSIFTRKKPLSENTLKRIYAGLQKFVAKGDTTFTKRYNGGKIQPENKVNSIDQPMGTILSNCTHALVSSVFVKKYYSGRPEGKVISVNGPAGTVKCADGQALVTASHLSTYYGNAGLHGLDGPAPTLTTKDRITKVAANFIDHQYGNGKAASIDTPAGTVTAVPKFNLVTADQWVMPTRITNAGKDVNEPAPTVLACRKNHYLVNPQYNDKGRAVDDPCFTLIARMDKKPPSVVTVAEGECIIYVFESDSPTMIKIKEFMCAYGIIDIKMRMLKIPELKQIQGFPKDYVLKGTQTEQKKYIGNAVEVTIAKAIATANLEAIVNHYRKSA